MLDRTQWRASARRVLAHEADALTSLSDGLDDQFDEAVATILAADGRVVTSGMGKSGHIARKIAATFASTGTPALFVHPAEASHGDLGMIAQGDVVLALSKSGESPELSDLVDYCTRFDVPLIALTERAGSALGRAARLCLILPAVGEACPLGLAPTTSTTLCLALGDALAVAVLEARGFTAERFRDFHPGGKLGRVLVRVGDLMHAGADVPAITRGTPMSEALIEMTAKRFGCIAITATDGRLEGIVTDGDLRRHMGAALLTRPVDAVMTENPTTIAADALAAEALKLMQDRAITALFVTDQAGRPAGILHIHDLLRAGVI